ncbi:hypothetical protein [Clostridium folliculivorans]|uniref:Membrane protein n=1 Tax=Clostridium folliculivorans TaxID=2886038 RepID=A0A9W5Y0W4_9CLOT|nr:hypothetical protein [Clostridium folliculivorans]GKU24485.1 membrane protein [Clostridium folliculivorans]GKU30583.1 membrane protein [Clostridium folliculivorans]
MSKRIFCIRSIVIFIFITFIISAIYLFVIIEFVPLVDEKFSARVKGDYVIMLLQCILGIVAMVIPVILKKRWHIHVPPKMILVYAIFLYCAIYLGEVQSFYYIVPYWDKVLHTLSGAMFAALSFSVITTLNKKQYTSANLSPIIVAVFAFCFAITLEVLWEIYEFTTDLILKTNMQKYALSNGVLLVGQAALKDTMQDLIVGSLGALIISLIFYISLKYKKSWIDKIQLKINEF